MLEGEVDVVADGERYTLRPGDVFWTGVGCIHAFYETRGKTGAVARDVRARARPTATRTASSATGSTSRSSCAARPRTGPTQMAATIAARRRSSCPEPSRIGERLRAERQRQGADRAGGRRAHRRLAEPDLADRARQGEPLGQHAVGLVTVLGLHDGRPVRERRAPAGRGRPHSRRRAGDAPGRGR